MRNRMYGGVRGRKTKVGRKLLRFPPTRFDDIKHHVAINIEIAMGYMITFNLLDNINSIFINFLKQIWIDMLVHSYDVDRALEQIFKEAFQANN